MSASPSSMDTLEINSRVLDLGYRNCKASAKNFFGPFIWMISNTTGEHRRGLEAILAHTAHVSNFLELLSADGLSLDSWSSYRNEISEALAGRCRKSELAALYNTVTRFNIPKQFIFDPLTAADSWIRNQNFTTMDQYNTFASRLGGSPLAAMMPILEVNEETEIWQRRAIRGGQGIIQALLLSTFVQDLQQGQMYFPPGELKAHEVDLEAVRAGECDKSFRHFCRVQVSRIESKLRALGKLVHCVEFDGQRCLTSLLGYFGHLTFKIKADPSLLFDPDGPVTKGEAFKFKTRHWLGLEQRVPLIPAPENDH